MVFQQVLTVGRAGVGERSSPILGKDEVASSNLASSSINTPNPSGLGVFYGKKGDIIRSDGVSRQYFNYDRGWDVEPTDENAQLATEVLLHSENW